MIIYLYGPDSYRRREKLKEYVERYKAKYKGISLSIFYLNQEADWDKLKDFFQSQSLFENSRLGIVSGIGNLADGAKKDFINLLKENLEPKELTLLINEEKNPTEEFNFLLKEPVIVHEFENLSSGKLKVFLRKEAKKRSLALDWRSENLLMQVYNGDGWGLVTELDKLALLDEKEITLKILEKHFQAVLPINIFTTINQIRGAKSIGVRLSLLEELLSRSEDPAMIFNLMAVSPYADSIFKNQMADYDAEIKSGKLEYEEALTELVISD